MPSRHFHVSSAVLMLVHPAQVLAVEQVLELRDPLAGGGERQEGAEQGNRGDVLHDDNSTSLIRTAAERGRAMDVYMPHDVSPTVTTASSIIFPKYHAEVSTVAGIWMSRSLTNSPVANDTSPHRSTTKAPLPK